jgi:hypothetical protein
MAAIVVHAPRDFFNAKFPEFFSKRVLAHLGEARKTKHCMEILLAILRGTFAEFELTEASLRVLRHAAARASNASSSFLLNGGHSGNSGHNGHSSSGLSGIGNSASRVESLRGRHPWAATVRADDSADDVRQRLIALIAQLPIKKISKLEAFQWRQSGRNLLRNVILQIAAQNLPLAFELLFNQARARWLVGFNYQSSHHQSTGICCNHHANSSHGAKTRSEYQKIV